MDAQPRQHFSIELGDDNTSLADDNFRPDDLLLEGDFYRESNDVTRGVTLPLGFSEEGAFQDFETNILLSKTALSYEGESIFSDLVLPPLLPAVSPTSLVLRAESPGAVAQSLLDFLANESGEILKVSAQKFAVKADVFQTVNSSILICRLKARVYRFSDALVVDFCRRSGDALAFQHTFVRASQHLLQSFTAVEAAGAEKIQQPWQSAELLLDSPKTADCLEEPALDPLLDMLRDTSPAGPAQQAEALVALIATALASSAGAIGVCAARGREADIFKACASSCHKAVSYHAEQLEALLLEKGGCEGAY